VGKVFGFNERAAGRERVGQILQECHVAWKRLFKGLPRPEPWLPRNKAPRTSTIEAFWAPYTTRAIREGGAGEHLPGGPRRPPGDEGQARGPQRRCQAQRGGLGARRGRGTVVEALGP